jgi:hypothetical protein
MSDKKFMNVYYFNYVDENHEEFAKKVMQMIRVVSRDFQWSDIPVNDFEVVVSEKNQVSETKKYRINVVKDSAINRRVLNTICTALYGKSEPEYDGWVDSLEPSDLVITCNKTSNDHKVAIAKATLTMLLKDYAPNRLTSSELNSCAVSTVRKAFDHFGFKPQVTKWSDNQL